MCIRDSAMIDSYVQDMGREGGLFQAYLDVQARFDLSLIHI